MFSFFCVCLCLFLFVSCVGVEEYQSNDIETYHCPNCQAIHGPLIRMCMLLFNLLLLIVVKRRRNWHRHDYSELNDGDKVRLSNDSCLLHVCVCVCVWFMLIGCTIRNCCFCE